MAGIDYGLGQTNVDKSTGIRYGVINSNSHLLNESFWEEVEAVYTASCPHCGHLLDRDFDAPDDCPRCGSEVGMDEQWADEPDGHKLDKDGYEGWVGGDGDLFLTKSLYYTFAHYCSPCAPGAGHLECPADEDDGVRTYCLAHDWFEGDVAPYPVYRVENDIALSPYED